MTDKEKDKKLIWEKPKLERLSFSQTLGGPYSATVDNTYTTDS